MITEIDLDAAIAECRGKRNPDASTCIKLAAYYTIKKELFGEDKNADNPSYSYAPAPEHTIRTGGDSEFAKAVEGREPQDVFPIIDELMATLKAIHPKLYNAVMNKLY